MEIHFTADTEAQLRQIADLSGQDCEQFVQDAVRRRLERELHIIEAVKRGEAELDRGEFLSSNAVRERVEQALHS